MKRLFVLFASLLYVNVLYSQDIITQKDGTDIQAKVTEVGLSQISYKKYSNLDGPTYIISKDDVLMITYENGEREIYATSNETGNNSSLPQGIMTFNSWSGKFSVGGVTIEDETLELYLSPEDYKLFKKGETTYNIGFVVTCVGAGVLGWNTGSYLTGEEPNMGAIIGGGIACIGGIVVNSVGLKKIKTAMHHYNSSLAFMPTINWGSTDDLSMGLALVIHF